MATSSGHASEVQDLKEIAHDMVGQLQALLNTDTLTDFEITCGGQSWKVHRLVLAMHSKVLLKACSGGFKEAQEQKLDLSAHDAADIGRLVAFMYTLQYSSEADEGSLADVRMYAIADQYDIASLKNKALVSFHAKVEKWGFGFIDHESKFVCELISAAYGSAAQPLCDLLVSKINYTKVLGRCGVAADRILTCIESIPEFGKDLVKAMSMRERKSSIDMMYPGEERYTCPGCLTTFKMRMERLPLPNGKYYNCPGCRNNGQIAWWSTFKAVD